MSVLLSLIDVKHLILLSGYLHLTMNFIYPGNDGFLFDHTLEYLIESRRKTKLLKIKMWDGVDVWVGARG